MFFRRADIKELDALLKQFQMNQENNYKDAAQEDFQKLAQRLEEMKNQSLLKEKEYIHYSSLVKKNEQTLIIVIKIRNAVGKFFDVFKLYLS